MKSIVTSLIIFIFLFPSSYANSVISKNDNYFFKRIDYQQGLSSSAVLCQFQDSDGLMWFGTYDGVNCWDGRSMEVLRSDFFSEKTLSNNIIHSISQADSCCLWIVTHLGLNRFSKHARKVVGNYDFSKDYYLSSNINGDTYIIAEKGIYFYDVDQHKFIFIGSQKDMPVEKMEKRCFVDDDGSLWTFIPNSGKIKQISVGRKTDKRQKAKIMVTEMNFHSKALKEIFYQNGVFCFIDSENDLYMYDISRKSKIYICNLSAMINKYGTIVGIAPFYDDIVIAFRTNGLFRLCTSQKYEEEVINKNIRVYGLYSNPQQGLLWIASDGMGAIMYAKKNSIANNLMLSQLSKGLSRQVRSIMTDKNGGLWLGTKGDGLIHIPDYMNDKGNNLSMVYFPDSKQKLSEYVKPDDEFHVYKLLQSKFHNGFWVCSGAEGLYFFSYKDNALHHVDNISGQVGPIEIHDIYEDSDNTLYVVTAGAGFYKLNVKDNGNLQITSQKHYHFYYDKKEISMFFPMLADGESTLWLGSREKGLVKFNRKTEKYNIISLKNLLHKSVDDVLSLCKSANGKIYVGTTSGLVCLTIKGDRIEASYVGREHGLLNDMIHGILEDANGMLWLGTNRGLIKYNVKNGSSHDYYYTGGVQIGEFSDDAYYKCPYSGRLFFGGVDGLLFLDRKNVKERAYESDIVLRNIWIGKNRGGYYNADENCITLKGTEQSFSISFAVPDYLSGDEVEYSFMLEGYDKKWSSFSSTNEITYADVPYGTYTLKVRYKKDVFDNEYKMYSVTVRILPPWYLSMWAYMCYTLLFIILLIYIILILRKYIHNNDMLKLMLNKEKESIVDIGIEQSFRNNINFLTLIYHACNKLRSEGITPIQKHNNIDIIRQAALSAFYNPKDLFSDRLSLFYPTIFSLTSNMDINTISDEILSVLKNEGYHVSMIKSNIQDGFSFSVQKNGFRCILYYCYMFMCKQTYNSDVVVDAKLIDGEMLLSMTTKNDAIKILYNDISGNTDENIDFDINIDDDFVKQFILFLIKSSIRNSSIELSFEDISSVKDSMSLVFKCSPVPINENKKENRKSILLLADREEMVWMIEGILSNEYYIENVKSIQTAFDELNMHSHSMFLVDMSIYVDAEDIFMEYVKKNKELLNGTAFVPMLTWKASSELQRELILLSDSYIVLPYDILFLKEVVHKVMFGYSDQKRIFISDLDDNLSEKIICTSDEQVDFVNKLLNVIEQNLSQEDLGTTFISNKMAMSPRQFYRRFKSISELSPGDFIKQFRIEKAARMLRDNGELSIQDIISEVGISSRSYFYKEFVRQIGMTPKDYRDKNLNKD